MEELDKENVKVNLDKADLVHALHQANLRIAELTGNNQAKREEYSEKLTALTQECEALRLENARLKVVMLSICGDTSSRCGTPANGGASGPSRSRAGTNGSPSSEIDFPPPEILHNRPSFRHNLVGLSHIAPDKPILHSHQAQKRGDSAQGGLFSYFTRPGSSTNPFRRERTSTTQLETLSETNLQKDSDRRSRASSGVLPLDTLHLATFLARGVEGETVTCCATSVDTCRSSGPQKCLQGEEDERDLSMAVCANNPSAPLGLLRPSPVLAIAPASTSSGIVQSLEVGASGSASGMAPPSAAGKMSGWSSWLSRVTPIRGSQVSLSSAKSSPQNFRGAGGGKSRQRSASVPAFLVALSRPDTGGVFLDASMDAFFHASGGVEGSPDFLKLTAASPSAIAEWESARECGKRARSILFKPMLSLIAQALVSQPHLFSALDELDKLCLAGMFKRKFCEAGEMVRGEGLVIVEIGELTMFSPSTSLPSMPTPLSSQLHRFCERDSFFFPPNSRPGKSPQQTLQESASSSPGHHPPSHSIPGAAASSPTHTLLASSPYVSYLYLSSKRLTRFISLVTAGRMLQSKHTTTDHHGTTGGSGGLWIPLSRFGSAGGDSSTTSSRSISLQKLRAALDVATTLPQFSVALRRNLHSLQGIKLASADVPRGAVAGSVEQARKDLERERYVIMQGKVWALGNGIRLAAFIQALRQLVKHEVSGGDIARYYDSEGGVTTSEGNGDKTDNGLPALDSLVATIADDLLVGLSRTSHGGDSYTALHDLLPRDGVTILAAETATQPSSELLIKGLSASICSVNSYRVMGSAGGEVESAVTTVWSFVRAVVREEVCYTPNPPTSPSPSPSPSSSSSTTGATSGSGWLSRLWINNPGKQSTTPTSVDSLAPAESVTQVLPVLLSSEKSQSCGVLSLGATSGGEEAVSLTPPPPSVSIALNRWLDTTVSFV